MARTSHKETKGNKRAKQTDESSYVSPSISDEEEKKDDVSVASDEYKPPMTNDNLLTADDFEQIMKLTSNYAVDEKFDVVFLQAFTRIVREEPYHSFNAIALEFMFFLLKNLEKTTHALYCLSIIAKSDHYQESFLLAIEEYEGSQFFQANFALLVETFVADDIENLANILAVVVHQKTMIVTTAKKMILTYSMQVIKNELDKPAPSSKFISDAYTSLAQISKPNA